MWNRPFIAISPSQLSSKVLVSVRFPSKGPNSFVSENVFHIEVHFKLAHK